MTPADRAEMQSRLADAQEALHLLLTGQSPRVFVDQNGERVEYATANAPRLRAYINEMKTALGLTGQTGPAGVMF